jgi:hypothetical protein
MEAIKELELAYIVDIHLYQILNLAAIYLL